MYMERAYTRIHVWVWFTIIIPGGCDLARLGQEVKGKIHVWSSSQGHFSSVDPGRSSGHGAYGSDPPLVNLHNQHDMLHNLAVY